MNLKFKRLHPEAKQPERLRDNSAGYIVCATGYTISTFANTVTYSTGLVIALPKNTYFDVRPVGSLDILEWELVNRGVIDSEDLRELSLTFRPTNPDIDIRGEKPYRNGDQIGQLILVKHQIQTYEEVDEL